MFDKNAWKLSLNLFNSTSRKYFANERVKKDKNDASANRNKLLLILEIFWLLMMAMCQKKSMRIWQHMQNKLNCREQYSHLYSCLTLYIFYIQFFFICAFIHSQYRTTEMTIFVPSNWMLLKLFHFLYVDYKIIYKTSVEMSS